MEVILFVKYGTLIFFSWFEKIISLDIFKFNSFDKSFIFEEDIFFYELSMKLRKENMENMKSQIEKFVSGDSERRK